MNSIITHVQSPSDYRKALKTWRPVILYFGHPSCYACEMAGPIFLSIAQTYVEHAHIYMLSTHVSPRHPEVTGTPTVLFYKDGKLLEKLKGFGSKQTLSEVFAKHVTKRSPKPVARAACHDLPWLHRTLHTLCTPSRARKLLNRRLFLGAISR